MQVVVCDYSSNKLLENALEQVVRHWFFPNVYEGMELGLI